MKHAHSRQRAANETPSPPSAVAPPAAAAQTPSKDEFVREAAYYYYEQRGRIGGHELDDWLRAEAEFERLCTGPQGDPAQSGH